MFNFIKINSNIVVQPRAFFNRVDFVLIYIILLSIFCILFVVFVLSLHLFYNYRDVYDTILLNIGNFDVYKFDLKIPGYKAFFFIFFYVFNLEFTYLSLVSGYNIYFDSIWWFFANFLNLLEFFAIKFNWWFNYHWFANYFAFNFQNQFLWWFSSEYIYPYTYDNSFHYYLDYRKKVFSRFRDAGPLFETAEIYKAYRLWTWGWFKHFFPLLTIKLVNFHYYYNNLFYSVHSIFYDPFYFIDAETYLKGNILYINEIRDADAHIYRSIRRLNGFLQMIQPLPFNEISYYDKYYYAINYYLSKFNYNNIILNYYFLIESFIYNNYYKYYNYFNINLIVFLSFFAFILFFLYSSLIKFYNKFWAVNSTFPFFAIDFKKRVSDTDYLTTIVSFYFIQNEDNKRIIFTFNFFIFNLVFNYIFLDVLIYIEKYCFIFNYFFYKLGFIDYYFIVFNNVFFFFMFLFSFVYFLAFFLFLLKYFLSYIKIFFIKLKKFA